MFNYTNCNTSANEYYIKSTNINATEFVNNKNIDIVDKNSTISEILTLTMRDNFLTKLIKINKPKQIDNIRNGLKKLPCNRKKMRYY